MIKGLTVTVDMKIGIKDDGLYAKELVLHAHLKGLDVSPRNASLITVQR